MKVIGHWGCIQVRGLNQTDLTTVKHVNIKSVETRHMRVPTKHTHTQVAVKISIITLFHFTEKRDRDRAVCSSPTDRVSSQAVTVSGLYIHTLTHKQPVLLWNFTVHLGLLFLKCSWRIQEWISWNSFRTSPGHNTNQCKNWHFNYHDGYTVFNSCHF